MMKNRYHAKHKALLNQKGFTLIEILMAIVLISIIGSIIAGSYIAGTRIRAEQEDVVEMQQNIRVAFYLLAKDLRMAGYELATNWDPSILRTANIIAGDGQTINFSYIVSDSRLDLNGDGLPDTGQMANISYSLVPNPLTNRSHLVRNDGFNQILVAQNISYIGFTYQDNNGNWTNVPPVVPSDTRAIGITVIAESSRVDRKLTPAAQTYTDRFLTPNPNPIVIYTSPVDQFRRRVGTMAVSLRNFGI